MADHLKIPKPLPHRMQELIQSLLVLRDCIAAVKAGNLHHFVPIYGQLRALLIEKAKNNKPLLLDLASTLKQPMDIWCTGEAGQELAGVPPEWKEAMVFNAFGFPVSLHQQYTGQEMTSIEKFLERNIVYYAKRHYKAADIIGFFANNAGGAHYAPNIAKDFAQMLTIGLNGQPVLVNFLLQIAEVTYALGLRVLKRLNDTEIHLAVVIREQKNEGVGFLFDTRYDATLMRASIVMQQESRIVFRVVGVDGFQVQVATNRLIDFTKPHYMVFLHQIDDKLNTRMSIMVDGERFGETVVNTPCFFVNELRAHTSYINRSLDKENTGAEWAMFSLAITDPEGSFTDRSRIFVEFANMISDEKKSGVVFGHDGFAYKKPGITNQELGGNFFWSDLGKVSQGHWDAPKAKNGKIE